MVKEYSASKFVFFYLNHLCSLFQNKMKNTLNKFLLFTLSPGPFSFEDQYYYVEINLLNPNSVQCSNAHPLCVTFVGNLKKEDEVLEWLIEQKSKKTFRMMIIITGILFFVTLVSVVTIPPDYAYNRHAVVITPIILPPPRSP